MLTVFSFALILPVTTASMMEMHSEPNRIQCCHETYKLLLSSSSLSHKGNNKVTSAEDAKYFQVNRRGIIKGKGSDMVTYWIEPNANTNNPKIGLSKGLGDLSSSSLSSENSQN